jgi:hypothetical protein
MVLEGQTTQGRKKNRCCISQEVLIIIYIMLKTDTSFEWHLKQPESNRISFRVKYIIAEAKKLGLTVIELSKTA